MFKAPGRWVRSVSLRGMAAYLFGLVIVFYVFFWRLSSLTDGLGPAEIAARAGAASLRAVYSDPINGPHKLLQYLFDQVAPGSIFGLRLASIIFGMALAFCFYKLAVSWFGRAIGLFGSLFFLSLPLFVISARQASAEIMLFSPIALMWLYVWLNKKGNRKSLAWLSLLAAAALLLYTPGMLWWTAAAIILGRKRLVASVSAVPTWLSTLGLLFSAALITPLVISIINNPELIRKLALLPVHWAAPLQAIKDIGLMGLSIFFKTPETNPLIIGRLPILNVLLIALLIFGIYAMQAVARAKAGLLLINIAFAVLAAGINDNPILLAFGLPAAAILISAGLRYLYIEWRSIFPRNPVPRSFALILIAGVTASQLYFGLRYALVAWPHSAATQSSYVLK